MHRVRHVRLSVAKRGVLAGLLAAGCLLVGVGIQAVVPVDDTWHPFFFDGVGSTVGPFEFTSLVPVRLKVTDGFLHGDRFEIFDNDGSYLGGPTLGVFNTAVSLGGVNDVVRVPDANSLDVGDGFSLEGWTTRTSPPATPRPRRSGTAPAHGGVR